MTPTFKASENRLFTPLLPFLSIWAVWLLFLALLLAQKGYYNSFLYLNAMRSPFLDLIMPHYTHLGEGAFLSAIFCLVIFNKNRPLVNSFVWVLAATGLILLLLKSLVFFSWSRPPVIFKNLEEIYNISLGGERYRSFPSGHSAAIWASMTCIVFYFRDKSFLLKGFLALLAASVAYSRVYIGVHFPGDILAGSMIGVLISGSILYVHYPRMVARKNAGILNAGTKSVWLKILLIALLLGSLALMLVQYYDL